MRCYWDERQRLHVPTGEFFNGALHPAAEHQGRVDAILAAIGSTEQPADNGVEPLLRVHSTDYVEFLQSAHARWLEAGREGDAFPYTFPIVGRRAVDLSRIDALLGQYGFDTSTPIGPATWQSAYWAVQTALAALGSVLGRGQPAFAFCRPPGHHAGADYFGGYSYLNNAAIAAEQAVAAGLRVAILDVDYHHGNGTQDIFAGRGDVVFASIHADPATDYPYFWGHSDESGGNILPSAPARHGLGCLRTGADPSARLDRAVRAPAAYRQLRRRHARGGPDQPLQAEHCRLFEDGAADRIAERADPDCDGRRLCGRGARRQCRKLPQRLLAQPL